jgi:hypothetical protein
MMNRFVLITISTFCGLIGFIYPSFVQSLDDRLKLVLVDANYSESFTLGGTRNLRGLSSRTIVGLHLGHGKGPFIISELAAPVGIDNGADYCLKLSSGDARYRSLNRYRRAKDAGNSTRNETHSMFNTDLAKEYNSDDVTIKLSLSRECQDDEDGTLIPAMPPGADKMDPIVVFINSRGSPASAALLDEKGATLAAGMCSPADTDRVLTYSEVCELPFANLKVKSRIKLQVHILGESPQVVNLKLDSQ